ncbi:MAG TPA: prephenate dehydrogenase/arogenate dehydrogenase family protein [Bryobacteraceae bacterium]|jgi:prephenate dehydrogenase|nr:prephenate dehydrogenase/arogenate dehydrogenase family protein [Bryobacteraceae bacterium]
MKTVAIAGVGLIGASFGLALREAGFEGDLIGVSSPDAIRAGLRKGAITRAASLGEAASQADLIYLAQPVDRILTTIEQLAGLVRPDTLLTDAGSTKQSIVNKAVECFEASQFLGGHPMAGKESRGAEAAEASLFRARPYVLTPLAPPSEPVREFKSWLARIGADVIEMHPGEHDRTVALTSHLPQLISTALAATLAARRDPHLEQIFGTGLLDMTRLAMSSADLWMPILRTNRENVAAALDAFRTVLTDLQALHESDRLVELFEVGSAWATELRRLRCTTPADLSASQRPGSRSDSQSSAG